VLCAKHNGRVRTLKMARRLGKRGGMARTRRTSAARRREIASLGGKARRDSLRDAKRIAANFRYLEALLALQGGPPAVTRVKNFRGRLPGIYSEDIAFLEARAAQP
jgi:hypothetical protein